MGAMNRVPTVLVQKFITGGKVLGVAPVGNASFFAFDNEAGGPFTLGETVSWSAGASTGKLVLYTTDGDVGTMAIQLLTGSLPPNDTALTGVGSSATADVNGDIIEDYSIDSEETIERGRYREYSLLTDGGLVEFPAGVAKNGFRILNVLATLPGITVIELIVVDPSGVEFNAGFPVVTTGSAYQEFRNKGILVAPNCKFKVKCTGTLSGDGQIMLMLGHGWGETVFNDSPELGKSNLVPGMQRPEV